MQTTVKNGNKQVTITITGSREWEGGDNIRVYFDLEQNNKRNVISGLYEIKAGSTRDHVVEVEGRKFGYIYGVDCNSNTKRRSADEAVVELAKQITR